MWGGIVGLGAGGGLRKKKYKKVSRIRWWVYSQVQWGGWQLRCTVVNAKWVHLAWLCDLFLQQYSVLPIQTWSKKKLGLTRVSVSSAECKEGRQQQGNHQSIGPWNLKVGEEEEIFKIALVIPLYLQSCISYLGPGTCHLLSHPTQNLASSWRRLLLHGLILWIRHLTLSGISLLSLPTAPALAEASPRQLQQLLNEIFSLSPTTLLLIHVFPFSLTFLSSITYIQKSTKKT